MLGEMTAGSAFGSTGGTGGTGKNNGPFCPQPDNAAELATRATKPCLPTTLARRPKIRIDKTMTGL